MNNIVRLVGLSITNPSIAAQQVVNLQIKQRDAWSLLIGMSCLWIVVTQAIPRDDAWEDVAAAFYPADGPLFSALQIIVLSSAWIVALFASGTLLGGKPKLADTVMIQAWPQVVQLAFQIGILAFEIMIPTLAPVLWLAAVLWLVWLTLHLTNAVMGFNSLWRSAGALVISVIGAAVLLAFVGVDTTGFAP